MKKSTLISSLRIVLLGGALFAFSFNAFAMETKTIEYKDGNTTLEGFVVDPVVGKGTRPGLIVVHDWLGLTSKTKERAEALAKLGYVVLAIDIYGKGVRPDIKSAAAEAGKYKTDRALFRQRLLAGLEELKKLPHVDVKSLGAVGYCFGGTGVIELARTGAPLKGVVSFHGGLDSPKPEDGKNIKAKILALHGADDPFVPAQDLVAFEDELKTAKVNYRLIKYPGAVHSFTDKSAGNDNTKGAAYNPEADRKSWDEMKTFFAKSL